MFYFPLVLLRGAACEVYRMAWAPVSGAKLLEELGGRYGEEEIRAAVEMLLGNKVMVALGGRYLAFALP